MSFVNCLWNSRERVCSLLIFLLSAMSISSPLQAQDFRVSGVELQSSGWLQLSYPSDRLSRFVLLKGNVITSVELRSATNSGLDGVGHFLVRPIGTRSYFRVVREPLPNPPASPPSLSPVPWGVRENILPISGVAMPGEEIRIEGGPQLIRVFADTTGGFSANVPLFENRINPLFVSASSSSNPQSSIQPIRVLQDSKPPTLFIDTPTRDQSTFETTVAVAGRVGDMLSGFRGLSVTAWVRGPDGNDSAAVDAQVNVGIGNNGTFERGGLPLGLGANRISVVAADILGNRSTQSVSVVRLAPTVPRLIRVSGEGQETNIHRRLAHPIVVRAVAADGVTPRPGVVLDFKVTRSDGRLSAFDSNGRVASGARTNLSGATALKITTDVAGEARAWWTVGGEAGCGNNRVCVISPESPVCLDYCASALPGNASQINVGTGNRQRLEIGAQAAEPLRAWVNDSCNGIPNVTVSFRVSRGGGKLRATGTQDAWSPFVNVKTSTTGHAEVDFLAGTEPGEQRIESTFRANTRLPATFVLHALARNPDLATSFRGLVLDSGYRPVGAAQCLLNVNGKDYRTETDTQGRFLFENIDSGRGHLYVNGQTATTVHTNLIRKGSYPALSFMETIVANVANTLPAPVLLPRLNTNNIQNYYGTNDVELTCEGMPGLKMRVKAGSLKRLVDGTQPVPGMGIPMSLNQVHHDQVPMPLPDGASPPFAWTLQPAGAVFDPPVEVEYPNMTGLPAGAIAYFLSFNHDTERFEIVASGHVSSDAASIVTDPGAGLTISGWGCNCPPYSVSSGATQCTPPPPSANGCGAAAMGGGWPFTNCSLVPPDFILTGSSPYFCFTTPCDNHDFCYGTCGTPKADCDNQFYAEMIDVCALNYPFGTPAYIYCAARAYAYYKAVAVFGGSLAYAPAQNAACKCNNPELSDLGSGPMPPPSAPFTDLDDDGLPDEWETTVGLRTDDPDDLLRDEDGDGLTNFQEFFFGFHPFRIDSDFDGVSDLDEARLISPDLKRPGRLDETWQLQLGGQTVSPDYLGNYTILNVTASDTTGPTVGSGADFLSDDLFRITGVSSAGGVNRYLYSDFVRLPSGSVLNAPRLYFTNVPPRIPVSLRLSAIATVINQLGSNVQIRATATYADGTQEDLNSAQLGTTFRVSDPTVVQVDGQGMLTALYWGRVVVTASNQGATSTLQVDITPDASVTQVVGRVLKLDGTPAASVLVRVIGQGGTDFVTGQDGTFTLNSVSTAFGKLNVLALFVDASGRQFAAASGIAPGENGVTDIGNITLQPLPAIPRGLSGGQGFSMSTRKDGSLWGWGENDVGQVGDGGSQQRLAPVRVGNSTNWVQVSSGEGSTVGIQSDGSLWSWGRNNRGQLGTGNLQGRSSPGRIGADSDWLFVSAGNEHVLALRKDGSLWAWGGNLFDEIGLGTGVDQRSPIKLLPGTTWRSVAAGRNHSLAVNSNGTLWVWGANLSFQLGDGSQNPGPVPRQIGTASDWEHVFAGGFSSFALKKDGSLWSWGGNSLGQLGLGDLGIHTTPTQVGNDQDWWYVNCSGGHTVAAKLDGSIWGAGENSGAILDDPRTSVSLLTLMSSSSGWQAVAAPTGSGCTLGVTVDGALWSWGENGQGQLGIGKIGHGRIVLDPVTRGVIGQNNFSAGNFRSAAVSSLGSVLSWGTAPVGDGTFNSIVFPARIPTAFGSSPAMLASASHVLLVLSNGALWGWADNFNGQVGIGAGPGSVISPTRAGNRTDWRSVSASSHSLGVTSDGALWAWGANGSGELGNGQTTSLTSPSRVAGVSNVVSIAAGYGFSAVVRQDGTLWTWGINDQGQLGSGSVTPRSVPAQVGTSTDWSTVSSGVSHVLAVRKNGTLWVWGRNQEGQLGDGTQLRRTTPVPIPSLSGVRSAAAGYLHSLVVRDDGSLWAWGQNINGQLGDGTLTTRTAPVRVGQGATWVAVSAGTAHTLAQQADGSIWACGSNDRGELGTSRRYQVGSLTLWGSP